MFTKEELFKFAEHLSGYYTSASDFGLSKEYPGMYFLTAGDNEEPVTLEQIFQQYEKETSHSQSNQTKARV